MAQKKTSISAKGRAGSRTGAGKKAVSAGKTKEVGPELVALKAYRQWFEKELAKVEGKYGRLAQVCGVDASWPGRVHREDRVELYVLFFRKYLQHVSRSKGKR